MSKQQGFPDWQNLGEQYWRGVNDLSKQWMSGAQSKQSPWHEGIEQWARMFQPKDASSTYEQLLEQGKVYLGQMESLFKQAAQGGGSDVRALFAKSIEQFKQHQPWLAGMGDYAKWFNPETLAPLMNAVHGDPKALLQLPTLGLAREHQERAQALAANVLDYQREMNRYNALMSKSLEAAVRLMEQKLSERSEPGREIQSAKALYDLWIDALEESYAEVALSDEFQTTYGDLVDAQMRVRAGIQGVVEKLSGDLGVPTRTEMDAVHRKQAEMRRQLRKQTSNEATALSQEVAALRSELAQLKREFATLKGTAARAAVAPSTSVTSKEPSTGVTTAPAAKKPAASKAPAKKSTKAVSKEA